MKNVFILALLALCTGCASNVTTSYHHFSSPQLQDDGYDLVCAGLEQEYKGLTFSGNACHNVSPNKGEYFLGSVTYRWNDNR